MSRMTKYGILSQYSLQSQLFVALEPLILSLEVTLKVASKATSGFGSHYLILEASFTLIASLGSNVMLKLAPESITCGFKAIYSGFGILLKNGF